jgi:putative inorganic carbon (HCO3(-)) transporter
MRSLLLLILSLYFFILALKSRVAGLYTYWWFAIFRPHDWDWAGVLSGFKLPLLAALIFVGPALLDKQYPRFSNSLAKLMLLFTFLLLVADSLNGCGEYVFIRTQTVFTFSILIYVVLLSSNVITSVKTLFWFSFVMAVSIGFHSGKGGISALMTGANYYDRDFLSGMFSGSNAYALGSGMLLFFMIFAYKQMNSPLVFKDGSKWPEHTLVIRGLKLVLFLMAAGTFYNIIALQSRGSFLATTLGLIILIAFQKYRVRMFLSIGVLAILVLLFAPLPDGYAERIQSAFSEEEDLDKSAASRPHYWHTASLMAADNPFGVGPGCFPPYYSTYDSTGGFYGVFRSVHSSHFQVLADSGYLGLLTWVLLFAVSFWKLFKMKKRVVNEITNRDRQRFFTDFTNTLICSQTVFVLGGSFYEYAYNDIIWLIFALVITLENLVKAEFDKQDKELRVQHDS